MLPQSPAGKILTLSWQAVPALLDSLSDSRLSRHQKEWVLSLLFSITVEHDLDPVQIGVLPRKWRLKEQSGEIGNGSDENLAQEIIPQKQDALIAKWKDYRQRYLDIRESDDR